MLLLSVAATLLFSVARYIACPYSAESAADKLHLNRAVFRLSYTVAESLLQICNPSTAGSVRILEHQGLAKDPRRPFAAQPSGLLRHAMSAQRTIAMDL